MREVGRSRYCGSHTCGQRGVLEVSEVYEKRKRQHKHKVKNIQSNDTDSGNIFLTRNDEEKLKTFETGKSLNL